MRWMPRPRCWVRLARGACSSPSAWRMFPRPDSHRRVTTWSRRAWLMSISPSLPRCTPKQRGLPGVVRRLCLLDFIYFSLWRQGCLRTSRHPMAEPVAIETHVHLLSDHARAALAAGWQMAELHEQVIDDRWVEMKPSWAAYRDVPISFTWVWRRYEI